MIGNDGGLNISWDQGKTWDSGEHDGHRLAYSVIGRHASSVLRLHRPAGQRRLGRPERDAGVEGSHSELGLVRHRRRRRVPDRRRSDDYRTSSTESRRTAHATVRPADAACRRASDRVARACSRGSRRRRRQAACVDGRSRRAGRGAGGGRRRRGGAAAGNVLNAQPGEQYRFNWNTPFMLSPHNPHIVWLGGNRLFKSYDRGDIWVASADLTKQVDRCKVTSDGSAGRQDAASKNDGVTSYSTIISISESPVMPGVVWAGTDDGNLQVSRDGGDVHRSRQEHRGLPAGRPRRRQSLLDLAHRRVALRCGHGLRRVDGHRSDDLKPYLFVTHDYGQTFRSIAGDLPAYGNVQVVREDPKNKDLLYVGTEFGLFISLDGGKHWHEVHEHYPTVRTDDILIHPRDSDLIVATHGRSIWIADDITPLQQLTSAVRTEDVHLFDVRPAVAYSRDLQLNRCRPTLPCFGQSVFLAQNAPKEQRSTTISSHRLRAARPFQFPTLPATSFARATGRGGRYQPRAMDIGGDVVAASSSNRSWRQQRSSGRELHADRGRRGRPARRLHRKLTRRRSRLHENRSRPRGSVA